MRIHLISDLHAEFSDYPFKAPEGTDVVVAAGDIHKGVESIKSLRRWFGDKLPIIFVPGNHEYYKGDFIELNEDFKIYASKYNIIYLHNSMYTIENVNFIGATFWSDYEIYGNSHLAKIIARDSINDFRLISYQKKPWERFTVEQTYKEHIFSKKWIESCLNTHNVTNSWSTSEKQKKSVVVTHMAPHPNSIHPRWGTTPLNAYYVSDQTKLIEQYKPDLWLHGHTHDTFHYVVDKTRIVCNPRGYARHNDPLDNENKNFNPNLLIEI